MARNTYAPIQTYTGDGTLNEYTFDFKIEALTQLLVIVLDDQGVEVERVRGDDNTYLDDVVFNALTGAGTVTLLANLPTGYKIYLILANDEPTQPYQFSNKFDFSLKRIESALDFITGAVQRLANLAKRSMRLHETEDADAFNMELPLGVADQAGNSLIVNETGDGWDFGEGATPTLQADINVIGVSQGQYNDGDVIPADTELEEVIRNMLTALTPPVFTLSGSGPKLVETGTSLTPALTPTYTANDAGPANAYRLFKGAGQIYSDVVPSQYVEGIFTIGDESISYYAEVDQDGTPAVPVSTLTSNTVTYVGARAAFYDVGGDLVNVRTNTQTLVGVQSGSQLSVVGDDASLYCNFAYPDSLGDPTNLTLSNTGGNFDITPDLVREADQNVNDASGANPVLYRVYSYTGLIALKSSDTITLTI